jgi:hypothetical protein
VIGKLVQKQDRDSTKWETMHKGIQKQYKTQKTQNTKQEYKIKTKHKKNINK